MTDHQVQELSRAANQVQPGESLAHFCATHIADHQCEADPDACAAFCGYRFASHAWDDVSPECVVCAEMLDARGDPECNCDVCERIGRG